LIEVKEPNPVECSDELSLGEDDSFGILFWGSLYLKAINLIFDMFLY
jgi:hypothetical protein